MIALCMSRPMVTKQGPCGIIIDLDSHIRINIPAKILLIIKKYTGGGEGRGGPRRV